MVFRVTGLTGSAIVNELGQFSEVPLLYGHVRPDSVFIAVRVGKVKTLSTWKVECFPNNGAASLFDSGLCCDQVVAVKHNQGAALFAAAA